MTQVRLALSAPTSDGTGRRPTGSLEWRPTERRDVAGDVVLPAPFTVGVGAATPPVIDVAPTEPGWAWAVVERVQGGAPHKRLLLVPDVGTVVDYADLVEVDPATLDPVTLSNAWWTQVTDYAQPVGDYATNTALSTGLAGKVNAATYTAGLAAKQDVATLGATVAADATVRAAFGEPGAVVASYFLSDDEALHLAVSSDGTNFSDAGVRYSPGAAGTTVRDPDIVLWNGVYYLAHTRPTTAGGGSFGTTDTIGLAYSADLVTWTEMAPITMPTGTAKTWAPEWFIDDDGLHLIVTLSTVVGGGTFLPFELHPTSTFDITGGVWSTPVQLTGSMADHANIDTTIVKVGSTYHAFCTKESAPHYLEHHTATALLGPYTAAGTGDWAGWFAALGATHLEGPQLIARPGGWRIFFDNPDNSDTVLFSDGSADFTTWSAPRPLTLPMRHAGLITPADNAGLRASLTGAWTPVVWNSGWAGSLETRRTALGLQVRGIFQRSAVTVLTSGGEAMCTIPGYRPSQPHLLVAGGYTDGNVDGSILVQFGEGSDVAKFTVTGSPIGGRINHLLPE